MNTRDKQKKILDAEEEVMQIIDRNQALANAVVSDTDSYDKLQRLIALTMPIATRIMNKCNRLEPEMKDAVIELRMELRRQGAIR